MGKDSPDIWNKRTFEDVENTGDQLLASFVSTLLDWSHACGFTTLTFHSSFYSHYRFVHNNSFGYFVCFLH